VNWGWIFPSITTLRVYHRNRSCVECQYADYGLISAEQRMQCDHSLLNGFIENCFQLTHAHVEHETTDQIETYRVVRNREERYATKVIHHLAQKLPIFILLLLLLFLLLVYIYFKLN